MESPRQRLQGRDVDMAAAEEQLHTPTFAGAGGRAYCGVCCGYGGNGNGVRGNEAADRLAALGAKIEDGHQMMERYS